jgi:hypothetical protein
MKYLFVISFILLSACGKPIRHVDPRSVSGVHPEFVPYVETYLSHKGGALNYDIPIGFTDLKDNTVGMCTRWSNGYRQIEVDQEYWDYASDNERSSLIAHELGHCDLNRGHSDDWNSIMYPYNIGSLNFFELFHPGSYSSKTIAHDDCVKDIEVESTISESSNDHDENN